MNEITSKEAVVLYHIGDDYGWRWAHEFLPKGAEVISMIALAGGQTTAVRYYDPDRSTSANAKHFDEIVTAVLGQKLRAGKLAVWARRDDDYQKRAVSQNVANLLGDLYNVASMSMALLALDVESVVQYLGDATDEALAAMVVTTLRRAELEELEKYAEVCTRVLMALPDRWRLQLYIAKSDRIGDFWRNLFTAALPTEN